MSNSFARHGIDHLSASSLNLWAAQPALWITERLLGRRTPTGIPAARGRAVEHGVHAGLIDPSKSPAECVAEAEREFNRETALTGDPRRDDERAKIAGYVRGALAELRQYGIPDAYQKRIEIRLDDVPVPVIGFIDWCFSDHGLIVDLKTAERFPSEIGKASAKGAGFDGKVLTQMLRERKLTSIEREEFQALCELYRAALGMLNGTPLGEAARKRLMPKAPKADEPGSQAEPAPDARPQEPPVDLDAARAAGRGAAKEGKRIIDNPFTAGDPRRAAWDEGWCAETGSDGMEIPAAWRRTKPEKKKPDGDVKPEGEGKPDGEGGDQ